MDFKDYYAALGVGSGATAEEIKHQYRKLARKFHPDLNKAADAEERFKDVAEAYKALKDPVRRAAYDQAALRHRNGQDFEPMADRAGGHDGEAFADGDGDRFSDFFSSLFGSARAHPGHKRHAGRPFDPSSGGWDEGNPFANHAGPPADQHARITIDLEDAYRGARRTITLQVPSIGPQGQRTMAERVLELTIPAGVHEGQHLRLAGQGAPAMGELPAGDLYLEIVLRPHPHFRVDGSNVYLDLPVAPWEAALGGVVSARTPIGQVELNIPPGSTTGRKLRLKGQGLPGTPAGDLYARIDVALPPSDSPAAREAYAAMSRAFPAFAPRSAAAA